jgi:hypothetical protein
VHRRGFAPVDARVETGARVSEADLPARERKRNLAVVHVPGENEVELAGLEVIEHAGVVAKKNREVGLARKPVRVEPSPAPDDQARIGSGDPHAPAAKLDEPALVAEQCGRLELAQVGTPRLRVTAEGDVVVAEHDECREGEDPH